MRWLLLAILLLASCSGAEPQDAPILRIGVIAPFEGEYEPLGRSVRDGVLLAAEAWNQRGGVLGSQVQLVLEDSQCDYAKGREAAQSALDEDVAFVIGAVCGEASEGVAQVLSASGALQISPASVDLDLTLDADGEVRPLVFRVPYTDSYQGMIAAEFALETLRAERAAVMYAEDSDYGSALATAFRQAFEATDGEVVAIETYDQDADLFFEDLERVREADPDLLYLPGYHTVVNVLVAQARSFGLLQPILGSDGWDSPDLSLTVMDGSYYTSHFYPDEPSPPVRGWVELFNARYLAAPSALATLSYDAANLLLTAISRAGVLDPVVVAQTLEGLTFEGVSGTLAFDEAHNPTRPVIILRVVGDRVLFVGRFPSEEGDSQE